LDTIILYLDRAGEGWMLESDGGAVAFPTLTAGIWSAHKRLTALQREGKAGQLLVRRGDGAWEVVLAREPSEPEPPAPCTAGAKG
jgi:hypothetical protein